MDDIDSIIQLYGTAEQVGLPVSLEAGRLSVEIAGGAVSSVSWDGVEVISGIDYPVRDPDWGTLPVHNRVDSIERNDGAARYTADFSTEGFAGSFSCEADQLGQLTLYVKLVASVTTRICRAGFVVLHPLDVAGAALKVLHPDGDVDETVFPRLISPSQPAMNVAGLDWTSRGVAVSMQFEGDVFEMEDQRNWSDASYKTFCRPLLLPYPFEVRAGETIEQKITLRFGTDGTAPTPAVARHRSVGFAEGSKGVVPEFGLALDPAWPLSGVLGPVGAIFHRVPRWLVRLDLARDGDLAWLVSNADLLRASPFDLEAIADGALPTLDRQLSAVSTVLSDLALAPGHLFVLPRAYMRCIQTWEPAPAGATPSEATGVARRWFPHPRIGAGMLTNFTELNRCPPAGEFDYVSHSLTPLVHAADDRSVMRSLDTLQPIFDTLEVHAAGRPYRLGLASIGMRTNPYGAHVAENPAGVRLAMAQCDPRQMGLFGAAWMVGIAASMMGRPLEFVALGAPYGPFGLVPEARGRSSGAVYPAYHAFAALAELSGQPWLDLELPDGLRGIAARGIDGSVAVIANCSASCVSLDLEPATSTIVLDAASVSAATANNLWSERAPRRNGPISLGAFGVAQLRWPRGARA